MELNLLFRLMVIVFTILSKNQVEASCGTDQNANPQLEFYNTSSCRLRRGRAVATIPNKDDQINFNWKCISLIQVAKRVNVTIPLRMNVWTRWHCHRYFGCEQGTNGGVGIFNQRRCTGDKKYVKLGSPYQEFPPHCIDRPGGRYVLL